jgi:hypothetical protein
MIDSTKNSMDREFQHWMESKLIEVMSVKMHEMQFASIVNLTQMKVMKAIDNQQNMINKELRGIRESQCSRMLKNYELTCGQLYQPRDHFRRQMWHSHVQSKSRAAARGQKQNHQSLERYVE